MGCPWDSSVTRVVWALNSITNVLIIQRKREMTQMHREGHVKVEAETRVM